MAKDTLEAIRTRFSCRAFSDQQVAPADLKRIAEAAVCAPSGMNRQPWRIIVISNPQVVANLERTGMANIRDSASFDRIKSRGGKVFYGAPAMIIVVAQGDENGEVSSGTALDCGIVAENIALAATSLGIDNVICGMARSVFNSDSGVDWYAELGIEKGFTFAISVLLGYAASPGGQPHEPDFTKISYV